MSVGRLLCVGIRGAVPGEDLLERDLEACRRAEVGGVILFEVDVPTFRRLQRDGLDTDTAKKQSVRNILDAEQLRRLIAHIGERLGPDVFVGVDQEGGQVVRLSPARGFAAEPSAQEFAALDGTARRQEATRQAGQLADLGFDLNFAPCVDVALEPQNAIITRLGRSFGAKPETVIECANVVLDAHATAGVAACLKHFPGHGSSRDDTHLGAVDITSTWQRELEIEPYRALCQRPGVAVMVAHVVHRKLSGENPASLAADVVDGLLRSEIGFQGVVITDSIDMRAVANRFDPGETAVAAIAAGADFVVDGFNLDERAEHPAPALVAALQDALNDGRIAQGAKRIEKSLERLHLLRTQIGPTGSQAPAGTT